jgi:small subunit ribosomal protein S6
MTTATTQRRYKAMMILDTRGREESVEQLIEEMKKEIASVEAEVLGVENLGRRDFARVTDAKMTAASYVEFTIAGSAGVATRVREHFRLNPAVYRVLVQSI